MTLPTSGALSLSDVLVELQTANSARAAPINLGDADVLALAGVSAPPISLSDLYGKSSYTPMTVTGIGDDESFNSQFSAGVASCSPSVSVSNGSGGNAFAWTFTSNPNSCALANASSQACTVSHSFNKFAFGVASAVLQCAVTDNTGHTVTATGINANLDWSNGSL